MQLNITTKARSNQNISAENSFWNATGLGSCHSAPGKP